MKKPIDFYISQEYNLIENILIPHYFIKKGLTPMEEPEDPLTLLKLMVIKALKDCSDFGLLDLIYKLLTHP